MGDRRFEHAYSALEQARDRVATLREMDDESVVAALAQSGGGRDPYLANILAVEASNRMRRATIITQHLGEGVLAFDHDGIIRFANPAVERSLGWRATDLLGRGLSETVAPEHATKFLGVLRTGEAALESEALFARADGARMPALCTTVPVKQDGDVAGAVLVFRDITERSRAVAEVRESRARLWRILDTLSDGVLLVEWDGAISFVNRAAETLFGVDRATILSSPLHERPWQMFSLDGRHLTAEERPSLRSLRERRAIRELAIVERSDGTRVPVEVRAVPFGDDALRPAGVLASYRDVSQEAAREVALHGERAIQDLLLEAQSDLGEAALVIEEGKLLHVNAAFLRMTGYAHADLQALPTLRRARGRAASAGARARRDREHRGRARAVRRDAPRSGGHGARDGDREGHPGGRSAHRHCAPA